MRFTKVLLTGLVAFAAWTAQPVRADQPRDWMVAAQPGGTYANVDVLFPGVQAQLEQRIPIFGQANELDLKVNALPTLVFYESQVDADIRLVILSLGASVGIRETFHALEFASGPATTYDAQARRDREFAGEFTKSFAGFGEGRATLSLPFNDNVVFNSINALRIEGGRDRVYDWRLGIMRDAGAIFRSDTTLYFKGRSWGAFGPRVQILNYKIDSQSTTQVNYGFTFTTRPGFARKNDILFLSVLLGLGGSINGVPTDEMYGMHLFKIPATIELAYRTVFELAAPSKPGSDD